MEKTYHTIYYLFYFCTITIFKLLVTGLWLVVEISRHKFWTFKFVVENILNKLFPEAQARTKINEIVRVYHFIL